MNSKLFAAAFVVALNVASAPSSAAILTYNMSWTGDAGYSMSGTFAFDDASLPNSPLVQEGDLTSMTFSFFDPVNTLLASYDLTNQFSFFNFNFESDTGVLRQSGLPTGSFGLALGNTGVGQLALASDGQCIAGLSIALFSDSACSSPRLDGSTQNFVQVSRVTVPEPGTLALFGLGLVGLGFIRRKRAA